VIEKIQTLSELQMKFRINQLIGFVYHQGLCWHQSRKGHQKKKNIWSK